MGSLGCARTITAKDLSLFWVAANRAPDAVSSNVLTFKSGSMPMLSVGLEGKPR